MLTKTCRDCGEVSPVANFYARNDGKPSSYCKPCHIKRSRVSFQSRYVPHPRPKRSEEERRQASRDRLRERQQRGRQWLTDYKAARGCKQCGESDPDCLDFHHFDPSQKEVQPATMWWRQWSVKRMEVELAKCIVLCSNCHRKLHASERAS